ncbi:MAG: hypothetical protein WA672_11085, partial [Candidatus Angelobacter sp.]
VIGFVLLRSIFLSSLENPEPRYMLECFPVVLALAGGAYAAGVPLESSKRINKLSEIGRLFRFRQ